MYGRFAVGALAVLISLCQAGQAEVIVGGPLYGGVNSQGGTITCRIFNFSATAVTLTQRRLYSNAGTVLVPTSDDCGAALQPLKSCSFSRNIYANWAFSCRAAYPGTTPRLSGVVEIERNFAIIDVMPMQNYAQ